VIDTDLLRMKVEKTTSRSQPARLHRPQPRASAV